MFNNLKNVNQGKGGCLWLSTINFEAIAPWQMMTMMIMRMMMVKSRLMMALMRTPMKTFTTIKKFLSFFERINF